MQTRLGSWLGRLWRVVGISLLLLIACDFLLRALLPADGRGSRAGVAIDRHRADAFDGVDFVEPLFREYHDSKEMAWTPYLYWRRPRFDGEYVRVGEGGRRHTWSSPGHSRAPRIFVFGGSTIWGAGARDDYTIPSLLAKELHERGVNVQVSNFGESGYVSTQNLLSLLLELRSGNLPDVVVFYDGANDLFAAIQAGHAGTPQNEDNRHREFNLSKHRGKLAALMLRKSFVGIDRFATWLRRDEEASSSEIETDALAAEVVSLYTRNLQIAEALSRRFGFATLYYWQPSVFSKSQRTPYEDSLVASRSARERALFARAGQGVAGSRELAMIDGFEDLSNAFDDTSAPVFFDFIHVSEAGNAVLAEAIGADLIIQLRVRQEAPETSKGVQ